MKQQHRCRECDQPGHNILRCPQLGRTATRAKQPPRERDLQLPRPSRAGYRQVCISMYDADLATLDTYVHRCAVGGMRRMSRSKLIAIAIGRLDIGALVEGRP